MRWFRKLPLPAFALFLAASAFAGKKDATPEPRAAKKEKGAKETPAATPDPVTGATPDPKAKKPFSLPLLSPSETGQHYPSTALRIPYYDDAGNLQMSFAIEVADKLNQNEVKMSGMVIQTYNEEGEEEMNIQLPESMFDLNTQVVSSHTKTTIRRQDFTITGDNIVFNTSTKVGSLVGNVHMTIYNVQAEMGPVDASGPPKPGTAPSPQDSPK